MPRNLTTLAARAAVLAGGIAAGVAGEQPDSPVERHTTDACVATVVTRLAELDLTSLLDFVA